MADNEQQKKYVLPFTLNEINDAIQHGKDAEAFLYNYSSLKENERKDFVRGMGGLTEDDGVIFLKSQVLNEEQKEQARNNIGAASNNELQLLISDYQILRQDLNNKVAYNVLQTTKTLEDKARARSNIGLNIISRRENMNNAVGIDDEGRLWTYGSNPSLAPSTFEALRSAVKRGDFTGAEIGTSLYVNRVNRIIVDTIGILKPENVTVDLQKFVNAVNEAEDAQYSFRNIGDTWSYNGQEVSLDTYGITIAPNSMVNPDDIIIVTTRIESFTLDIIGQDREVLATTTDTSSPNHSITLISHNIYQNGEIPFRNPELIFRGSYSSAEGVTSELKPGWYAIELIRGGYSDDENSPNTLEDGFYAFRLTSTIPVGGGIWHSTMGQRRTLYSPQAVQNGVFITYTPQDENGVRTPIEVVEVAAYAKTEQDLKNDVAAYDENGVSLITLLPPVTFFEEYPQEDTKLALIRNSLRNAHYGRPDSYPVIVTYLNSSANRGTKDKPATWWEPDPINNNARPWQIPIYSELPGFLCGIDPKFVAVLTQAIKVYQDLPVEYQSQTQRVSLPTDIEVGLVPDAEESAVYPYFYNVNSSVREKFTLENLPYAWWTRTQYNSQMMIAVSKYGTKSFLEADKCYGIAPLFYIG